MNIIVHGLGLVAWVYLLVTDWKLSIVLTCILWSNNLDSK